MRSHSVVKETVVVKKVCLSNTCESLILLYVLFVPDSHTMSWCSSRTFYGVQSLPNDRVLLNYVFMGFFKPRLPLNRHKTVVTSKILTNKLLGGYILPLKAKSQKITSSGWSLCSLIGHNPGWHLTSRITFAVLKLIANPGFCCLKETQCADSVPVCNILCPPVCQVQF